MKPVYKCDYCSKIGTKEEIRKHEEICFENYNKKSCFTCKHRKGITKITCENGVDVPEGKFIENCTSYERKEKENLEIKYENLFGNVFGNIF